VNRRDAAAALTAVLLLSAALPVAAQQDRFAEAWLLYEQGKVLLEDPRKPEVGEALLKFREAIDRRGADFPEAEMAIGDVYRSEGAYALAQQQYEKAYSERAGFDTPDRKYEVLYKLADLFKVQDRYYDMERQLNTILESQPYYSEASLPRLQDAFLQTFEAKGLDQVLRLYRMEKVSFALQAHAELGWFYYRTGRFDPQSILHSLFALDIAVTESMLELRRINPEYVYSTLEDFLAQAALRDNVRQFLQDSGFYRTLYYLGAATYAASHPALASSLWKILASVDPAVAGEYPLLARRQLQAPWVEPYLNPSARSIEYPGS
jgi:hypothetical protein